MTFSDRLHRLTHFEYWPFWAFYLPVFIFWPWWALRSRSLVFFSNVNPFIPLGGSLEESKSEIMSQLPRDVVATWSMVKAHSNLPVVSYWPVVAKPDVGERGELVRIIYDQNALENYAKNISRPFIIQSYIDYDFEAGVMVIKNPITGKVKVSSVVTKGFLSVTGDGVSTIEKLASKLPRARFQMERLSALGFDFLSIPNLNEVVVLEKIGNHSRGTTFIDSNHLITAEVIAEATRISNEISRFYFGRFDLKAPSPEAFCRGEGWKVLELNGAFSEPGHIYDPKNSLLFAWKDLVVHWNDLSFVSRTLRTQGYLPSTLFTFLRAWFAYRRRET